MLVEDLKGHIYFGNICTPPRREKPVWCSTKKAKGPKIGTK